MRTDCGLKIVCCYGLWTQIFGQNPWTDVDENFSVRTPNTSGSAVRRPICTTH